jgi:transcriptional regulator
VRIIADVYFDDALTDEALERVVAHMERNQQEPWNLSALGARYEKLRSGVMGFRAQIRSVSGRFKLGQDESDVVFENILNQHSNEPLRQWMIRMRGRQ